jgi:hypothetical protein
MGKTQKGELTGKEAIPWRVLSWTLRASREASGIAVTRKNCKE